MPRSGVCASEGLPVTDRARGVWDVWLCLLSVVVGIGEAKRTLETIRVTEFSAGEPSREDCSAPAAGMRRGLEPDGAIGDEAAKQGGLDG